MKLLDKTYDPSQFEKDVYNRSIAWFYPTNSANGFYTVLMPPPNVTGSLHMGHALTYTIQDILIRYNRQNGLSALWQPGMDHAGIATQMVVSRELEKEGIDVNSLTREELIERILEWKEQSGGKIFDQQKALGCSAPWSLSRFTMDKQFCEAVNEAFVALYEDNLIFRAKRLVNWDTKLQTAISDLEIQNKEEEGILWYIKYNIVDSSGEFITVATTRPETMFGDAAVAVHPDDDRYKNFVGKQVIIPYTNRKIPVIADDYVDRNKGSGCLKITPAHDFNDFIIGQRHNLEMITVLDVVGHMVPEYVPEFLKCIYLKKARNLLVRKLKEDELLVKEEKILHSVPYGDRSGTVIEPRLTDQWFIETSSLAELAIKAVEEGQIKFYPAKWENTYFDWMRNIEPWCISRQIVWGHRIPAWYGPNGEVFVEKNEDDAALAAAKCGFSVEQLYRETDVLDTWFSSALWPFVTLGWPEQTEKLAKYYPTSVLVTGFDIIFFWVARMIMMSQYFMKEIPFKNVYIHALVRDEKGQKMSKSKGNVIDPLGIMNEFGADALRFTLAFLSVPGRDVKFGKEQVKISRNFITKIWNAARFLQFKEIPFGIKLSNTKITSKLGNWVIAKLKKLVRDIEQNIRDYRFDYATRNIQFFLRDIFCDFFIETIKFQDDGEILAIAGGVFSDFLRITNPFLPFVTDHLAKVLGICDSFVLANDGVVGDITTSEEDEKEVDKFVELVHEVRSEKQANGESDEYTLLCEKLKAWPGELKNVIGIVV
ncbi:MAG: valine--tRNA ligase [Holosporales bacterium]|jgi:valyl-tRNA synthetase|nr:valine--tRNA ligase [Holosporales bacterium]